MGSSFILPGIDPKQGNRDLITKKTQYSILFFLPIIEELESLSHQLQYSYPQVSCLYSPSILITPGYQNLHNRATPPLLVNWTIVDSESEKTEIGFDSKDTYTDFWRYSRSHTSYKNGGGISVDTHGEKGIIERDESFNRSTCWTFERRLAIPHILRSPGGAPGRSLEKEINVFIKTWSSAIRPRDLATKFIPNSH